MVNRIVISFIFILMVLMVLFVGKTGASELGPDMDLAESSASFLGESWDDYSGWAVAGVGDVNNDGYTDILIGAMCNDDGGDNAGQTYLILGRASGWSMDTDLSNADASFWGEHADDRSGVTVAGAGDVNGDGYDDMLIGSYTLGGEVASPGYTYLIFGRESGWSMDTDLSTVDASFIGENGTDISGCSVAGAGDVNGDGYDDILIGARLNSEGAPSAGQTYLIFGKASGWSMDTNLSNADASFLGEGGGDNSGCSVAGAGDVNGDGYDDILIGAFRNLEGGFGAGQTYLIHGKATGWSMDTDLSEADASFWGEDYVDFSGSSVAGAGDVNGDGYDDILIGSYRNDEGGLEAGQAYLILGKAVGWSMDTDLSEADASFWGEHEDDYAGYSVEGTGDVNGDGYDDMLIGAVNNDDGGKNAGKTYLVFGKPSGWSLDTNLSAADASFLGESDFDTSGASVTGAGDVNGDGYDDILIGAHASDVVYSDAGQTYLVFYEDVPPKIVMDMTPSNATTGDAFTFNVTVSDNSGIFNATIEYWYGEIYTPVFSTSIRASGDGTYGTWLLEITIPLMSSRTLHYVIHVRDLGEHLTSSPRKDVVVRDNDGPRIGGDMTPETCTTGETLTFGVLASDNIGIEDMEVRYAFGDGDETIQSLEVEWSDLSDSFYSTTIEIPSDSLDALNYFFVAEDLSGNVVVGTEREVIVLDNDRPTITFAETISKATKGLTLMLTVEADDNIGIEGVFMVYRFGDRVSVNQTMGPGYSIGLDVARHPEGDLMFQFSALDTSGNWNTSELYSISLVNAAPEWSDIPQWSITEGREATLDLEPYLSDLNDDETLLTVECDDETITVDGLLLRTLHDEAVEDRTVHLTASDGEDDAGIDVMIHIVNVNDAPSIVSISPENGTKFKQGKTITFTVVAVDEDGDGLDVTWTEGDRTLGSGTTLDYSKLKSGKRTIKVTVSDGEASVEDEFTVVITKEEETPMLGGVFVMLAMLVGMVATMMRRKDKR